MSAPAQTSAKTGWILRSSFMGVDIYNFRVALDTDLVKPDAFQVELVSFQIKLLNTFEITRSVLQINPWLSEKVAIIFIQRKFSKTYMENFLFTCLDSKFTCRNK